MGRRSTTRITQKIADAAKAEGDNTRIWDAQQSGFGLRVRAGGRKTWIYRWRVNRREVEATIGVYRDSELSQVVMPLAKAREIATAWRAEIDKGNDPRSALRSKGATVADVWAAFIEHKSKRENRSPKTLAGYQQLYEAHVKHPTYGIDRIPIRGVERRDIVRLQRAVADQGRRRAEARYEKAVAGDKPDEYLAKLERKLPTAGNGAANSAVRTLSSLFSWLVSSGELDHSPAEKITPLPTAGRDSEATLDQRDALEALALIRAYTKNDGHRDILQLLLLTAQRTADIRERHWSDLILDDAEWPLPYLRVEQHKSVGRTKAAKRVPLAPPALAVILERWPGGQLTPRHSEGGWEVVDEATDEALPMLPASTWCGRLPPATGPMFPGADPTQPLTDVWHVWREIASTAKRKRVRQSDVHGLRHAGASLMQAAGVPKDLIKQLLHHSSQATTDLYTHGTADAVRLLGELLSS